MVSRSIRPLAAALAAGLALVGASAKAPPAATPAPAKAPAQAAAGTPHIKFETTEVKLGQVVHGQDAVATINYQNTGDAPLHILSAKPG